MTTKEMIEVMQAYERGEEIEFRLADCEDRWAPTISPLWNWEKFEYRIKPKETKFRVGDVLVRLEREGEPLGRGDIYRIVKITGSFILATLDDIKIKFDAEDLDIDFVKADDVLWYWEYQNVSGEWEMTNARYTKSDLSNEVLGPNERETATPIYALGFRLPQNLKEEK